MSRAVLRAVSSFQVRQWSIEDEELKDNRQAPVKFGCSKSAIREASLSSVSHWDVSYWGWVFSGLMHPLQMSFNVMVRILVSLQKLTKDCSESFRYHARPLYADRFWSLIAGMALARASRSINARRKIVYPGNGACIDQKSHKWGRENNTYPTMSVMNPDQFGKSSNAGRWATHLSRHILVRITVSKAVHYLDTRMGKSSHDHADQCWTNQLAGHWANIDIEPNE